MRLRRITELQIVTALLIVLAFFCGMKLQNMLIQLTKHEPSIVLTDPITVNVNSVYKFFPSHGINVQEYKNVGVTFYSIGDGYTPGITARSGRYVYDGSIAVSQPMWNKLASAGDLILVKSTNRWYRVEDTMHSKYTENRVDIYTHSMDVANSGSSKSDILIMRQPK